MAFWPKGTIFVSVVDPGVGTPRRACVAVTADGYYVVTPNNGSLTHLNRWSGITEVREIDESINRLKGKNTEDVSVFHGRDLFVYCAARLASGLITYEQVGPKYPLSEIVLHPLQEPLFGKEEVQGIFEIDDPHFSNLWTNIPTHDFLEAGFAYGDEVLLTVQQAERACFSWKVRFHPSFGFAQKGNVVVYNNELMRISVAVNRGNFSERYQVGYEPDWLVRISKKRAFSPPSPGSIKYLRARS